MTIREIQSASKAIRSSAVRKYVQGEIERRRVPVTDLVGVDVAGRVADVRGDSESKSMWGPLVRTLQRVELRTVKNARTGERETWVYWMWDIPADNRIVSLDKRDWFQDCGYAGRMLRDGDPVPQIDFLDEPAALAS